MRSLTLDCGLNCSKEGLSADGLAQKVDRSGLQCALARGLIGMRCDEDDGDVALLAIQMILKVKTIHSRQIKVEDQTRRMMGTFGGEERFSGFKRFYVELNRPHQALQGCAYRRIVIHYRDTRRQRGAWLSNLHLNL